MWASGALNSPFRRFPARAVLTAAPESRPPSYADIRAAATAHKTPPALVVAGASAGTSSDEEYHEAVEHTTVRARPGQLSAFSLLHSE